MTKHLFATLLALTTLLWGACATAMIVGPDYVLQGNKWGSRFFGTGATVTYSFMPSGTGCVSNTYACTALAGNQTPQTMMGLSQFLPIGWEAQVAAAFTAWSNVADITFQQVTDNGALIGQGSAQGDIRIGGMRLDGPGGAVAYAYDPYNGSFLPANSLAGDIFLDITDAWKIGFGGPGFDLFQVMAHQIGHAIGLRPVDLQTQSGLLMNPIYSESYRGPQAGDIAGARALYGAAAPVVPVPAGLPLLATGLGLILLFGRSRRSKACLTPRGI